MGQLYVVTRRKTDFVRISQIESREAVIGRNADCEISLADAHVSRRHALLLKTNGGYRVRDLGSRNGTRLNGHLISCDEIIGNGAEIEIGPFVLNLWVNVAEAIQNIVNSDDLTWSDKLKVTPSTDSKSIHLPLTPAQRRVYDLFLLGLLEKEVALRLGITIGTVHCHAKAIYKTLSVSTRSELILYGTTHQGRRTFAGL